MIQEERLKTRCAGEWHTPGVSVLGSDANVQSSAVAAENARGAVARNRNVSCRFHN